MIYGSTTFKLELNYIVLLMQQDGKYVALESNKNKTHFLIPFGNAELQQYASLSGLADSYNS